MSSSQILLIPLPRHILRRVYSPWFLSFRGMEAGHSPVPFIPSEIEVPLKIFLQEMHVLYAFITQETAFSIHKAINQNSHQYLATWNALHLAPTLDCPSTEAPRDRGLRHKIRIFFAPPCADSGLVHHLSPLPASSPTALAIFPAWVRFVNTASTFCLRYLHGHQSLLADLLLCLDIELLLTCLSPISRGLYRQGRSPVAATTAISSTSMAFCTISPALLQSGFTHAEYCGLATFASQFLRYLLNLPFKLNQTLRHALCCHRLTTSALRRRRCLPAPH